VFFFVQHAIAYLKGEEYYGAKETMNVWDPHIEASNEFSLSQMWVFLGTFDGSDLNSIEAGWQVVLAQNLHLISGYALNLLVIDVLLLH
jgi:hypothetical protein